MSMGARTIPPSRAREPNMITFSNAPAATERSRGRAYFWAGVGACLLGLALAFTQFSLKQLFVPWYSPALATLGALLLLVAVARRRTVPRVAGLVLVAALAGLQWYVLGSMLKLPDYAGPARPGQQFPAFTATLADGCPVTDA